jgi:hypothetical protein
MDLNPHPHPPKREELTSSSEFSTKKCRREENPTNEYIMKINHAYFFAMCTQQGTSERKGDWPLLGFSSR